MKRLLTHNWGLKLVSLGLAIITWIYVNNELVKYRSNVYQDNQTQSAQ